MSSCLTCHATTAFELPRGKAVTVTDRVHRRPWTTSNTSSDRHAITRCVYYWSESKVVRDRQDSVFGLYTSELSMLIRYFKKRQKSTSILTTSSSQSCYHKDLDPVGNTDTIILDCVPTWYTIINAQQQDEWLGGGLAVTYRDSLQITSITVKVTTTIFEVLS